MISGTSGNSALFCNPSCTRMLICRSVIQDGLLLLTPLHDQPQRPSISPFSIASDISLPPGYPVMTLILAPNTFLRTSANTPVSALYEAAPATKFLVRRSFQLLTADVCQPAQTLTSLPTLPSQLNFRTLNGDWDFRVSGSSRSLWFEMELVERSLGVLL